MQESFRVRRANSSDKSAILACLRAAFDEYEAEYTEQAFADTVLSDESLDERLRTMVVWIAVSSDDEIAGTLAAGVTSQGEGHLRGMAVHPRFQRQGIATALLTAALTELRARGCRRVTLDTTEPLLGAVRFYESNGFRPTGRVSPFFGMDVHEYERWFE